jgi:hypothetical protein
MSILEGVGGAALSTVELSAVPGDDSGIEPVYPPLPHR